MKDLKFLPIILIAIGVLTRLFPHPPNVAPITAIALFGGVYLPKKYAFILPVTALFISDYFIGFYGKEMVFVYGSFLMTGVIGVWLQKKKHIGYILGATLISSLLFFIVTNFGVWVNPKSWYSKDVSGLLDCYIAAIPFFRNTLIGDLVYTGAFFGAIECAYRIGTRFLPRHAHTPRA